MSKLDWEDQSAPRPERSSFYFFWKNKKAGVEDG